MLDNPKAITKDMTMEEILNLNPRARETLTYFHIGGCSSCLFDYNDSLSSVAEKSGAPVELLVKLLNEVR